MLKQLLHKIGLYRLAFPPGHFASPIPDFNALLNDSSLFDEGREIHGIDFRLEKQVEALKELESALKGHPYHQASEALRYGFNNGMLGPMDALILYAMLVQHKPKQVIEVGSGYSSAIMLDVNNTHRDDEMTLTFIEPYPSRLHSLLKKQDYQRAVILEQKIQDVNLDIFKALNENDILFLDTSHIVKTGSDVNFWLFHILPVLEPGVLIHIHDIFWPMEYPKEWIIQQKCYTELYLIRAFLMNNSAYEIQLFNNMLQQKSASVLNDIDPILMSSQGGSIWLKKVKR
jgi:predicted O-methyltransferase YrrM